MYSGRWGGALNRDNQFVIYLQHNHFSCRYQYSAFFLWDLLLSYPPSNTTIRCKKLKCDFLYYLCDIYIITFIIVNIFTEVLSSISTCQINSFCCWFYRRLLLHLHGNACSILYECHQHPCWCQWAGDIAICCHCYFHSHFQFHGVARRLLEESSFLHLLSSSLYWRFVSSLVS